MPTYLRCRVCGLEYSRELTLRLVHDFWLLLKDKNRDGLGVITDIRVLNCPSSSVDACVSGDELIINADRWSCSKGKLVLAHEVSHLLVTATAVRSIWLRESIAEGIALWLLSRTDTEAAEYRISIALGRSSRLSSTPAMLPEQWYSTNALMVYSMINDWGDARWPNVVSIAQLAVAEIVKPSVGVPASLSRWLDSSFDSYPPLRDCASIGLA